MIGMGGEKRARFSVEMGKFEGMADAEEKKLRVRSVVAPAIVASVLTAVLAMALPQMEWRGYFAAWVGTFFVWSIWTYVFNMY